MAMLSKKSEESVERRRESRLPAPLKSRAQRSSRRSSSTRKRSVAKGSASTLAILNSSENLRLTEAIMACASLITAIAWRMRSLQKLEKLG